MDKGFFAPRISGDTRFFWENAEQHKLTVQKCGKCGKMRWPTAYLCPDCLSEVTEIAELPPEGVLYSFVVMQRPFHPSVEEKLPYVVAEVDFPGGVRLVSNLVNCDPEKLSCGQKVRLQWSNANDYTRPVFVTVEEK